MEWESIPIDDARFSRRVAIDGRPLTDEERARESEREARFRTRLRRLRAGELEPERNETAIVFDEELVARYALTLDGEEQLRNRPSYRIAFAPRDGDLPVRRGMDRGILKRTVSRLNSAGGRTSLVMSIRPFLGASFPMRATSILPCVLVSASSDVPD